jgi:F-actin capping protein alpha subunit
MFKKIKKAIGSKGKKHEDTNHVTEEASEPVASTQPEVISAAPSDLVPTPAPVAPPVAAPVPSAVPSAMPPPKAKITPPSAPAPPPRPPSPPRRNVASAPVKSAAVVTAQGLSDDNKVTTSIPGGIPAPHWAVTRSNLPKEGHFATQQPLDCIRTMVDMAPAGLLGSLVADVQDLSYAYMDADFLRQLQATDQQKRAMANGTAQHHALGPPLAQEFANFQAQKYSSRGATFYRDLAVGNTASEIIVTTHAEMLDGHNSRTGHWAAVWTIHATSWLEAQVSGQVNCRAWCYEDCTAHMFAEQTFDKTIVVADNPEDAPLAKVILAQIIQWEKEVMEALTAVYGDEMDGTLKKIRRTLPITRTRLKWALIAQRAIKSHTKKGGTTK